MRELSFLNKGVKISIEDKRSIDRNGIYKKEIFKSKEGLKEFVSYLDKTRESIIKDVIYELKLSGRVNVITLSFVKSYPNNSLLK